MTVKFEVKMVTSELATTWLKRNTNNRNISMANVQRMVRQMENGTWLEDTAEPIKFSESGELIDGQCRLTSIVMTGIPIRMHVAYNVPDEAFKVLDTGRVRTKSDLLKISGYKYASLLATICRKILLFEDISPSNQDVLTRVEGDRIIQKIPEASWWNRSAIECLLSPTTLGLIYYKIITTTLHPKLMEEFMTSFISGDNLTTDSPVFQARNTLLRFRAVRMGVDARYKQKRECLVLFKAWNFYVSGTKCQKITVGKVRAPKGTLQNFPEIK